MRFIDLQGIQTGPGGQRGYCVNWRQVTVRHEAQPRTFHHLVIFPSMIEGMVVRKWWTHDHDVGIQTPLQGQASPEMVLRHLQELLAPEISQNV